MRFSLFLSSNFTWLIWAVLLSSFTLVLPTKKGSENIPPFKYADHPKGLFLSDIDTVRLSGLSIELIAVSKKENGPDAVEKIWVRVFKGKSLIQQAYFQDLKASDKFMSGLVYETKSIRPDCFLATIYGGEKDQIMVINRLGEIKLLNGGKFFLSNDRSVLFAAHGSEMPGLTVFDLKSGETLFDGKTEFQLNQWYYHSGFYYADMTEDPKLGNKLNITYFDFKSKKPFVKKEMNGFIRYDKVLSVFHERVKRKHDDTASSLDL